MAQSLGHLAATVSLDINPFKAANGVLKRKLNQQPMLYVHKKRH